MAARLSKDGWNNIKTRREAREWIKKHYGYISERPDLQIEPHGWKMPVPVKVRVVLVDQG